MKTAVRMGCGASTGKKTPQEIVMMAGKMWKQMDSDKSSHITKEARSPPTSPWGSLNHAMLLRQELTRYFDSDEVVCERLIKASPTMDRLILTQPLCLLGSGHRRVWLRLRSGYVA